MSVIGVPIILAPIFGPTLGGLIIDHLDWRWIFYVNVPVGIVAVAMGMRLLPNVEEGVFRTKLDRVGLALLAAGVPLFVYGLAEIGRPAPSRPRRPRPAGRRARARRRLRRASAAHPVPAARRAPVPHRAFSAARSTTFCLGGALFGAMILMPLYFQIVRGEDAVTTGLLLIPRASARRWPCRLAGRFTERVGGGRRAPRPAVTLVTTRPFIAAAGRHVLSG